MMLLDSKPGSIVFRHGDSVAGECRFGDEFKPHFHPLRHIRQPP